ncbi:MAG: NAD-dependent epimerase/dehydratase family protein [Planctomycetota bacterium]
MSDAADPDSGFWRGKRVLVTGGNGFIGSHLVERLLGAGASVTSSASSEATSLRFLGHVKDDVRFAVGDLRDPGHCMRILEGQDQLMHLAARVGGIEYNIAHPASIFRENMHVFLNCMEAARAAGTPVLVTSSACVYPRHCSIPTPEVEGFEDRPEPTNEGYGWAKRMEEFLGEAYAREFGMHVRIARPYNAYGPRDNFDPGSSHVIPAIIRRVFESEEQLVVWGDGRTSRSFLFVEDFVRGLMVVAERSPQIEAINIGADEETSIGELAETLVELSGRDLEIVYDTEQPAGQPRRHCDTRLSEELLGYRARVSLREGLAKTISWFLESPWAEGLRR